MSATSKIRLDHLLVERGLADSRAKAQALVMAGLVYTDTRKLEKPGTQVRPDTNLTLKGQDHPWVSRGGLKLDHGLNHFGLDVTGATALDIGASTGGFTDVLLSRGVAKVYAVDVGNGQLAWRLRQDERVIAHEKTNARYLTAEQIPEPVHLLVCDASFIGLRTVLPAGMELVAPRGQMVVLIKPQFEVGREHVGKNGVVSDPALHKMACKFVENWVDNRPGWAVVGITESPVKGPQGNREFLLAARKV